jgi:hypothetical protein
MEVTFNLGNKFGCPTRQTITSVRDDSVPREEFDQLIRDMDVLRLASLVPPERFFKKAQKKIDPDHYKYATDGKP